MNKEVFTTSVIYRWSFVTQIVHNGSPSHGGDRKTLMTFTLPRGTLFKSINVMFFTEFVLNVVCRLYNFTSFGIYK